MGLASVVAALLLGPTAVTLPPVDADWDYQLGGNRSVPDNVTVVDRDRNADPLEGAYNICYVNGFQTQPDEKKFWRDHWSLVLKRDGKPVVDSAWGEWLLDIRTDSKRQRLAGIVGRWTDGCADDGFAAVEFDNLDSFSRSHGLVSRSDAKAYAALLVARGHDAGLAVAQKNWVELGDTGTDLGFDFAIAEECGRWRECQGYLDTYGDHVLFVEYRRADFSWTCDHVGQVSVVRRDVDLSTDGIRQWC